MLAMTLGYWPHVHEWGSLRAASVRGQILMDFPAQDEDHGDRRKLSLTIEDEGKPFWDTYDADQDRWVRD
jgi:hypothetical protein